MHRVRQPPVSLVDCIEVSCHQRGVFNSAAFGLTARYALTAAQNGLSLWGHETFGVKIEDGVDEIALAFSSRMPSRELTAQELLR
jgi:hypothetical protein